MISRFQKHGFADARDERKLWLARQTCKLAADIRAMSVEGGGTGSARADSFKVGPPVSGVLLQRNWTYEPI